MGSTMLCLQEPTWVAGQDVGVDVVDRVGELIDAQDQARVLVAVDGSDAAGKTTFADQLTKAVRAPTVRVSVDSYLRPRHLRYQRGELSPEGYYLDSFDHEALLERCLRPFHAGADQITVPAEVQQDHSVVDEEHVVVPARAVLMVDGVFLLRERLRELWTVAIYLEVSPAECLERARRRDRPVLGSVAEVERRYRGRYLPGQVLYRDDAAPETAADVLIDNEDPTSPVLLRCPNSTTG